MSNQTQSSLRSQNWFTSTSPSGFVARSWTKNQGYPHHLYDGRPVIGICNTWSELTPCNGHFRILAEMVKRGVYEAGGFPLEFPVMSLGEALMRPTTMLFRNLAAMDVEETIRANPIDGVVLLIDHPWNWRRRRSGSRRRKSRTYASSTSSWTKSHRRRSRRR